jgi:predicted DNA-binding protein
MPKIPEVVDRPKRTKVALYSWLTPELDASLRTLSEKTKVPLSSLVAEAIEDLLKKRRRSRG